MLSNSPPLPLIIDHLNEDNDITTEDVEGIILALRHRDRVRRVRFRNPIPILQKLVVALDGGFPILEYLLIEHQSYLEPANTHNTSLNIPATFRAPNLRYLVLMNFDIPIGSPLLTTMENLVTLSLDLIPPSAYFHPNALLQRISLVPQLEMLGISFSSHFPSGDIERQLLRTPITTVHVTLPNLRWFGFRGASAYLEVLLPWITFALLEKLQIYFFNQLTYSTPHLQQFMGTAGNLRLNTATLTFSEEHFHVRALPHKEAKAQTLSMVLSGRHLDWQVASAAQVFHTLGTVYSAVEHLTLKYYRHPISSEWSNEADHAQWRELFRTFSNAKTLVMDGGLVGQLSRSLQPAEGESPTDLLPELHELSYHSTDASDDAFFRFIDARQKADRPVTVIHL